MLHNVICTKTHNTEWASFFTNSVMDRWMLLPPPPPPNPPRKTGVRKLAVCESWGYTHGIKWWGGKEGGNFLHGFIMEDIWVVVALISQCVVYYTYILCSSILCWDMIRIKLRARYLSWVEQAEEGSPAAIWLLNRPTLTGAFKKCNASNPADDE